MKKALAAVAAIGLALPAAPALAEGINVPYNDLNLASEKGQKVLEQRIDVAARKACGLDEITTGTRIRSREGRKCYAEIKAEATKQLAAVVEQHAKGG